MNIRQRLQAVAALARRSDFEGRIAYWRAYMDHQDPIVRNQARSRIAALEHQRKESVLGRIFRRLFL